MRISRNGTRTVLVIRVARHCIDISSDPAVERQHRDAAQGSLLDRAEKIQASMPDLDDYIEKLYDDTDSKIKGTAQILEVRC